MRTKRRYVATTEESAHWRGTVYFGGHLDDYTDCWTGGQVVFHWERRDQTMGPPKRVLRIVELANRALDAQGKKL